MPTELKIKKVEELVDKLNKAKAVYLSDYKGMNVLQMTQFRKKMRESGIEFVILKNTLVKIAIEKSGFEDISEYLTGTNAFAFGYEDPVLPAKIIMESFKDIKYPVVKGGLLAGKRVDSSQVINISKLPSKEILLSQVVGTFAAPISGFIGVSKNILAKFVRVIDAISKQKAEEN